MKTPIVITVTGLLLVVLLSPSPRAALAQNPGLTGSWALNLEESDDPRAAFQRSMRNARRSGMPRRAPGRPGSRGAGGRGQMQRLMQGPLALNIIQDDSTVTIVGREGTRLVLHTDGRKVEYPIEGMGSLEAKARWKGEKLVIERKFERGPKITETYEIAEDGARMYVQVRIEGGQLPGRVDFRRVYDARAEGG